MPRLLRPYWGRLEASPIAYRLAKGFGWSFVGAVLSRVLGVCTSIVVARIIGKVGVGQVGMVQSTVGMFSAFAGLGMGLTATKYVAEFRHTDPGRASRIIKLSSTVCWCTGLVITLLVVALAPWLARKTLGAPELAQVIQIGSVLLLLGAVNGGQMGVLAGFEAFKTIAWVNFCSGLVSLPVAVTSVHWWGVAGAVWALVLNQALACAMSHAALRAEAKKAKLPDSSISFADFSLLWHFSLPGMLCTLVLAPANWICNALVVSRPGGYAELGVFNAASSWSNAMSFLPSLLGQVVLPVLSQASGERNVVLSRKVMLAATKVNALFALPLVLAGCLVSPFIMRLYGPGFETGWSTLVLVLLTAGLVCLQGSAGQLLVASGRMWLTLLFYCVWGLCAVGLTWQWVGAGAFGLAGARLFAQAVNGAGVLAFALWFMKASNSPPEPPVTLARVTERP
jgi:O-antigen/teichoic acid export membrane protein